MITRRALLAGGGSLALGRPGQAGPAAVDTSLAALAAAKGLVFGSAAASYELRDGDFAALLPRQVAQVASEYEMNRKILEPRPGAHDFSGLDKLFAFASRNGLSLRGTPLVWYAVNPPWLSDALAAKRDPRLMTGHIDRVMRRYRLRSVDVVNEAIAPDGNGLRPSLWLGAFGPSYVDMAFHAARAADPSALLVYNDWGCEQGAAHNDRFRAATLRFLDGLLARRVPVDALGLQGHLAAFGPHVDQRKLSAFLQEIEARGLQLLVSELDVEDSGGPSDAAARDRAVADEARRFLDVVLDSRATRSLLTWGLSDRYLDPPDDWKLKLAGWKGRKLPYDRGLTRKPLWEAIAASLAARRVAY
jgi:endo-1,4-beta-xylanase